MGGIKKLRFYSSRKRAIRGRPFENFCCVCEFCVQFGLFVLFQKGERVMESDFRENLTSEGHPSKDELFFQLFMTYQRNLYAFILASIHNYADANDLLQETATVMWRKFDQFKPGTSFLAWGIAIAHTQVLKFFNEHKRSRIQFDDSLVKELADTTMTEMKQAAALTEALRECLKKLSPTNQKLLQLRYQEGKSVKAIASSLGKPVFGLYKAFARLQDALQVCIENTVKRSEGTFE